MATFGTVTVPVRTAPDNPINVNTPDGFMTEPPGDLWWVGLHEWWAAAIPASVSRATAIIVNPLIRMPWLVITPDGTTLAPTDRGYPPWLLDPMLLNGSTGGPNRGHFPMPERLSRFDFFARWVRDALQLGLGLLAFQPDSSGQPSAGAVTRVPASALSTDETGDFYIEDNHGERHMIDPVSGIAAGWRIVPLRHSIPGGVFGRHRAQLQLATRVTEYSTESLNTGTPSGVLTTEQPVTLDQSDMIREEWMRTQIRRQIAVLGNGAKYQQVAMSPVEAEIIAMARLSNEQIAHMFELAAWHLDASLNSMTYSNAQDNRQELVDGTLASWSARIEETVGSLLPWGWSLRIDFTKYTTPTTMGGAA